MDILAAFFFFAKIEIGVLKLPVSEKQVILPAFFCRYFIIFEVQHLKPTNYENKITCVAIVTLSLFYFGCSSEDSVKTSSSNAHTLRIADPDVLIAKGLYSTMMASTEYSDLMSSINAFNSKLKAVNRAVTFTDKSDWLDWINTNIGTTGFTDKVEFETMYDDMIDKQDDLIKANEDLFEYIADADEDQIAVITGPRRDADDDYIAGSTSSTCEDGCYDIADDAVDYAISAYNSNLENVSGLDPVADLIIIAEAERSHFMELQCIGQDLGTCVCVCNNGPNC